jgi:phage terminase small subunit
VLNPLVAYLIHLEAMITRTEKEFGMTPMARARLDLKRPSADEELEQLFGALQT